MLSKYTRISCALPRTLYVIYKRLEPLVKICLALAVARAVFKKSRKRETLNLSTCAIIVAPIPPSPPKKKSKKRKESYK